MTTKFHRQHQPHQDWGVLQSRFFCLFQNTYLVMSLDKEKVERISLGKPVSAQGLLGIKIEYPVFEF